MSKARERFSPAQCRAGRALLRWSIDQLADAAHLEREAIELFEAEQGDLAAPEIIVLGGALNEAGVIALAEGWAGEGVRLRECKPGPRTPFDRPRAGDLDDGFRSFRQHANAVRQVVARLAAWLQLWPEDRAAHDG